MIKLLGKIKFNQFGQFKLLRGSKLYFSRNARISINKGSFFFNKKWTNVDPFNSLLFLGKNSEIIIENSFDIYSGAKIYINENAKLKLGSGYINHNSNISCFEKIHIGRNVVISENVTIRDSDNHSINNYSVVTKPIHIGDNVWIGINVTILKGVSIGSGAVVAAGSVVVKDVPDRTLVGGVPAVVIKTNIDWF